MKKTVYLRHGDLALVPIKSLPEGLKKAKTNIIMTGSHNNDHKAINCDIYFKDIDQFVFGYLVAKKGAKLLHPDHGDKKDKGLKEAKLPVGVYELRKQHQETHTGMVPVID